jgi:methionine-rich copper-binding protein CopC
MNKGAKILKRILVPLVFVGLVAAAPAYALRGVELTNSSPTQGETVSDLHEISLSFSEPVQLLKMNLLHEGKRKRLDVSRVRNAMTLRVPLDDLQPGQYSVQYSGMTRSSGKLVAGTLSFTVSAK